MGRVRTKTVKRASVVLIEKYYPKLTNDFQVNKRICDEVAIIPSKRLRNKIAGYTTHLMRRIQRGPVRGISFKLQEEERERKDNYVPEFSALDVDNIEIDPDTKDMLKSLNIEDFKGITVSAPILQSGTGKVERRDFRRHNGPQTSQHKNNREKLSYQTAVRRQVGRFIRPDVNNSSEVPGISVPVLTELVAPLNQCPVG
ncbi:40S ribosomal protein S17-B, partial [Smittium mucronatum]